MATSKKSIDLVKVFGAVASTLAENRTSLNQADDYNHDHGDHMVQTFEVITQAMKEKKSAAPSTQLAYAAQLLKQKENTGSSSLYAQGLTDAADSLMGQKKITPDNAMQLLQSLLGAGGSVSPVSGGAGDLLGSLLGGLGGMQGTQQPTEVGGGADDLLGSLLGGMGGGTQSAGQQGGIDVGTLLNAGMSFMQAKQQGSSNLDAILNAVVGSSRMNSSNARQQSGAMVANTLMQMLGGALKK